MGAVFRCPVWVCGLEELRALLTKSGLPLYGAALRTDTVDVRRADFSRCAVAVGSEGKGLSAEALAACDLTVKIPMSGHCESLNAAVAAEGNRNIGSHWTEGVNHLSGKEALYYSRIRATDSDFGRTGRQRQVIEAILTRFKQLNILDMGSVAFEYLPYVTTNLSDGDIVYLASIAPQILDYDQETMAVPNEGTYQDLKLPSGALVLDADLEENSRMLREFLYPSGEGEG